MTINEKDRLDLRQEFERIFNNKRIAEIAMEALPPIDYSQLATKRDVNASAAELRGEMSELRGEFAQLEAKVEAGFAKSDGRFANVDGAIAELRGEMHQLNASTIRTMVTSQITTVALLGGFIAAIV